MKLRRLGDLARGGVGWYLLRVLLVIAVLGTPIAGTSYVLVTGASKDIAVATRETSELRQYGSLQELFVRLCTLRGDLDENNRAAFLRDRIGIDSSYATFVRTYDDPATMTTTRPKLATVGNAWKAFAAHGDSASARLLMERLKDVSFEIDDDSPLENDPNNAVQYIASTMLHLVSRLILDAHSVQNVVSDRNHGARKLLVLEQIAANDAASIDDAQNLGPFLAAAIANDPTLRAPLEGLLTTALREGHAYNARTESLIATGVLPSRADHRLIRDMRRTIAADVALWQALHTQARRLVGERRAELVARRRTIVMLSILAMLIDLAAIVLVGRYIAGSDRIQLASAKLETDKLRAEVLQLSAQRALRVQEAQFRSVFENADLGIVLFGLDGMIEQMNPAVALMLGDQAATVLHGHEELIASFETERAPAVHEERIDGPQWLALTFSGVYTDGKCQMVILLLRDITEEKVLHAELTHAANHDGLTQLANRPAFEAALRMLMDGAESFALFFIDLDRFKPINDTYGHAAGDHVLVTTAERLRSAVASIDLCARLGGDEFAVIVRTVEDRPRLESIATRIVRTIANPIAYGQTTLEISASVGVAERTSTVVSGSALKVDADRALYAVKARGGNDYALADSGESAYTSALTR